MDYLIRQDSSIIMLANITSVKVALFPSPPPRHEGRNFLYYGVEATEVHGNRAHTLYTDESKERCQAFLKAYGKFLDSHRTVVTVKEICDSMHQVPDLQMLHDDIDQLRSIRLVLETARDTLKTQMEALAEEDPFTSDDTLDRAYGHAIRSLQDVDDYDHALQMEIGHIHNSDCPANEYYVPLPEALIAHQAPNNLLGFLTHSIESSDPTTDEEDEARAFDELPYDLF